MTSEEEQILLDVRRFGDPIDLLEQRDQAYNERNRVVAFLARVCRCFGGGTSLYGAGLAVDAEAEAGYQNVVFIDTPAGQLSWHFADRDRGLFHSLSSYTGKWDGHTTEERHRRLDMNL